MLSMHNTAEQEVLVDEEDPGKGTQTVVSPFEMIISTYGGSAVEMFGIYDMMRRIRQDCPIHSTAIGKVMSAGVLLLAAGTKGEGVLLLAAGTKGERRIGANCRVMIHDVKGGSMGDVTDLENEFAEIKWIQERYIKILAAETDMTENYIKKLIKKKVNVYISAQEAVELGIADEIF
jgi:ATP-dependent Clp protease protease subunit